MSFALDAAAKVHDRQVATVTKSQDLTLKSLEKLGSLRQTLQGKVPQAPEFVTESLATVAQPVANLVGSPADYRTHAVRSAREWISVQERFQSALVDLVAPVAVKPAAPARKEAAKRA